REQAEGALRSPEENVFLLSPIALPFYGSPLCDRVNTILVGATVRRALTPLGFRRPITYTFIPSSVWVARQLGEARVVYHCVDDFAAFGGATPAIAAYERELCARADLVIASSLPLLESRRAWNPRTILLRHGVEHTHFARALDPRTVEPPELA